MSGRALLAVACLTLPAAVAGACGGTTGREGLALPTVDDGGADVEAMDGPTGEGGAADATVYDTGAFDVVIQYADQVLPDISAPPEGGADAGYPWPTCPPFIPVGADGTPAPLGSETDQVPADPVADGGATFAADGGACATWPWLGSTAADECVTSAGGASPDFVVLPPCSWCVDAGNAVGGSRASSPREQICFDLYQCIMSTGCGARGIQTCLCGPDLAGCDTDASGPCKDLELAALEYDPASIVQAIKNYTDPVDTTVQGLASFTGHCGGALNQVFQIANSYGCVDAGGGD